MLAVFIGYIIVLDTKHTSCEMSEKKTYNGTLLVQYPSGPNSGALCMSLPISSRSNGCMPNLGFRFLSKLKTTVKDCSSTFDVLLYQDCLVSSINMSRFRSEGERGSKGICLQMYMTLVPAKHKNAWVKGEGESSSLGYYCTKSTLYP